MMGHSETPTRSQIVFMTLVSFVQVQTVAVPFTNPSQQTVQLC
jgi:hypothetical protein